jgi:hypothetical protein
MDTHRREYRLRPKKLHVKHVARIGPIDPISPRRYTLTHSDITGELDNKISNLVMLLG